MNRYVNISLACTMAAFLGAAINLSAQAKPAEPAKPAAPQTKPAAPPAKPTTSQTKPAGSSEPMAGTVVNLGTVNIPRAVKADGQALAAGAYQVRVTETPATPPAAGQTPQYERWAEFLRGGKVVGREVVTIVPASDIKQVAEMTPPPPGGSRADVLKGNDYLRLWINRGGNHYLIHFNI